MAKSIDYYLSREIKEPDWIIPGFLKRGNTGFIIGEPKKACKSWLLLNLMWDLSEGKPIWGIPHSADSSFLFTPPRPMRVLYFAQEDTEDDLNDRIRLCIASGRKPNNNIFFVSKNLEIAFDTNRSIGLLHAEIDDAMAQSGPIDLLQFDPMRRMHYQDENASDVIARLWKAMYSLQKKYNCGILFSHHLIKPTGEWFDPTSPSAARGSGDIRGGGDAFVNVVHVRTEFKDGMEVARQVRLHFELKRGRAMRPILLRVSFETGQVEYVKTGAAKPQGDDTEGVESMTGK